MYYLDMFFPTSDDIPDFGTISLTDVGEKIVKSKARDQYGHLIDLRIRKYTLLRKDINKLSLINNAADGSEAIIADTSEKYILCSGDWHKWTGSGGSDEAPDWENI